MKSLLIVLLLLQGCAVTKQLVPTGGSRADGTVTLAFEYGIFEAPQPDAQQGLSTARQRCAAWGYDDATPFGGAQQQCIHAPYTKDNFQSPNGGSCGVFTACRNPHGVSGALALKCRYP